MVPFRLLVLAIIVCLAEQPAQAQYGARSIEHTGSAPSVSSRNVAGATPQAAGKFNSNANTYTAGEFLVTTTSVIEGYTILSYKGLVEGASVRVPTWSEDATAGKQEIVGGTVDVFSDLFEEARIRAFNTMVDRAKKLGANGIIGIHFDSQSIELDRGKFATGVVCVGTAIVIRPKGSR